MFFKSRTKSEQQAFGSAKMNGLHIRPVHLIVEELEGEIKELSLVAGDDSSDLVREKRNLIKKVKQGGPFNCEEHPAMYGQIKQSLLRHLNSPDVYVRVNCAIALSASADPDVIQAVAERLNKTRGEDSGFEESTYIRALAGVWHPAATKALLNGIANPRLHHNYKLDCGYALRGCPDKDVQDKILGLYRRASSEMRQYYLVALGQSDNPEAIRILVDLAKGNPESLEWHFAVTGLAGTKDPRAIETLIRGTRRGKDWNPKRECVLALQGQDPAVMSPIFIDALLGDVMGIAGGEYCSKVCPITDPKTIARLRASLDGRCHEERGYAAIMLKLSGQADRKVIDVLLHELFVDECPENRDFPYGVCATACAEALRDVTDARVVERLRDGLFGRNDNIRHACAIALGRTDGLSVIRAIQSSPPNYYENMQSALHGTTDLQVIDALCKGLRCGKAKFRAECAGGLTGNGSAQVTAALTAALISDKDDTVRRTCAAGLRGTEDEAALAVLLEYLADDTYSFTTECAISLMGTRNLDVIKVLAAGIDSAAPHPGAYARALRGQVSAAKFEEAL